MRQFLDRLNDEWQYLVRSRDAARTLSVWAEDQALQSFADLDAVVAGSQRRGRPAESDGILLALLRRAPADNLAARAVLQAIMPGLKSLMSAYQLTAEPEEVATAVIEAAFERIRCYPCDRRPERVAANLLNDTRQTLWRAACKERTLHLATEPLTEPLLDRIAELPGDRCAADQIVDLVAEAVRAGRIKRSGARLILLTRMLDVTVAELAAETQAKPQTLRKRRRQAEAALGAKRMVA